MTKLHLNLRDILLRELHELSDPLEHTLELEELLTAHRLIAHVWSVEDALEVRPDLTEDQAWEVLQTCDAEKDSLLGISWETIRCVAEELYGPRRKRS